MTELISGYKYSSGVGYVVLPIDISREEYVQYCLRTETVLMATDDGGYHQSTPVDTLHFQLIEFPDKVGQAGSTVIYLTEEIKNKPFIIGVLKNENIPASSNEGSLKLLKQLDSVYSFLSLSAKNKFASLGCGGDSVLVSIFSQGNDARIKIEATERIDISARVCNLQAFSGVRIATGAKSTTIFQQTESENNFQGRMVIGNGTQAMIRGNKLEAFLNDFISEIASTTVATAIGTQPLINSPKILLFKTRVTELLSTLAFLE